jgi:N-acetylmuramoyl-L-alanine amidase
VLLACCLPGRVLAAEEVDVTIDGQALDGAFLSEGTTMVPLRRFCELALPGCSISWDVANRAVKVEAPGLLLTAQHGSEYIIANDRYLFTGPFCRVDDNGVFCLPVRVLAKAVGAEVSWDGETRSVTVTSGRTPILSGSQFYSSDDVYWLSRIIYAEAGCESLDGQIAVGNVVLNRVNSSLFPNTIYSVIFQTTYGIIQFSPIANGAIYNTPTESCVIAAKLALDGGNTASDSLYFLNIRAATTLWVVRNCDYVTTIGNHSFYM